MARSWTFNQKIKLGFAVVVTLSAITGLVAIYALRDAIEAKDRVIAVNARNLTDAANLDVASARVTASFRGFLAAGEQTFLDQRTATQREFDELLRHIDGQVFGEEGKALVNAIEQASSAYKTVQERVVGLRATSAPKAIELWQAEAVGKQNALSKTIAAFANREKRLLQEGMQASTDRASLAMSLVSILVGVALALATIVAIVLGRILSRQIGATVQHVQSSSAELQSAATQQATGARECSTAMNEIATTISELLVTSRQIADSAQQVAQIAQEMAGSARQGDQTVEKTQVAIGGIRAQVDVIVAQMLDLGRKSQRIGSVLDIINELAEQTNILSINATIEAAGAGEAGKRFAVVGDEIRKAVRTGK